MNIKSDKVSAKRIFLLLTIIVLAISSSRGQTIKNAEQTTDSTRIMLHPDQNTQYMDELGRTIDSKQFATAIQTGQYSFVPDMKNGRVKNIRLKKESKTVAIGEEAPDFVLKDINGKQYSLKEMRGKTIVLHFWFTGCVPCALEMPELNNLVEKYKQDTDIVFLAVTYDAAKVVKDFISKKDFKFNIVADEQALITRYGITSFPASIIIDKNGGIAFLLSSYNNTNAQQLDGVISALK